tara:strand:+ start:228 stop:530 length:303 start_codon:yes stop_codon:yes gene_type:complete
MGGPFKLKGMDFGNSPLNQDFKFKDKEYKTNVPLSEHEKKKGTEVIGGSKEEEINDLEMRIEDLRFDLEKENARNLSVMEKGKIISQIKKLEAQLKKVRG